MHAVIADRSPQLRSPSFRLTPEVEVEVGEREVCACSLLACRGLRCWLSVLHATSILRPAGSWHEAPCDARGLLLNAQLID